MTWRPIDTAPRDGRVILAHDAARSPMLVYWSTWLEEHWQPVEQPWREAEPTHWLPMPEPG